MGRATVLFADVDAGVPDNGSDYIQPHLRRR